MRIGVVIGHPIQFEGPLFQFAAQDLQHEIRVIYVDEKRMQYIHDPELPLLDSWGIDLLKGYSYRVISGVHVFKELRDELNRTSYDLLVINGYSKIAFITAALLGRLHSVPIALRMDSVLFNNQSLYKRAIKRLLLRVLSILYDHFFAIGTLTREYLEYFGIDRGRISIFSYVVDNAHFQVRAELKEVDKQLLKQKFNLPANGKIVISVAKFNRRESPWDLVRAFRELPAEDICLLLVGDGDDRGDLQRYADAHRTHSVVFTGYVPYLDLPSLYGISDLFVHPALDEPWGVSVQEAMASGLPVIASPKVGSAYDLIVEGENGFIYTAGDVGDLRTKLTIALHTLKKCSVQKKNWEILSSWDYEVTWKRIVAVARRYSQDGKSNE